MSWEADICFAILYWGMLMQRKPGVTLPVTAEGTPSSSPFSIGQGTHNGPTSAPSSSAVTATLTGRTTVPRFPSAIVDLEPKFTLDQPHRGRLFLPRNKFAHIIGPMRAVILQILHRVAHEAQLLGALRHLPLHVRPIAFVLRAGRDASTSRGGSSRGRGGRARGGAPLLLVCALLREHAFRGGAVGAAD